MRNESNDGKNLKTKSDDKSGHREAKSLLAKMQNILRDSDSDSIIMHRFDEITKFLLIAYMSENSENIFTIRNQESPKEYANRIRRSYVNLCRSHPEIFPKKFSEINASELSIYNLGKLLQEMDYSNLELDFFGLAYEEIINGTFDKNENQQFFTPTEVVKFMTSFLPKNLEGLIADPACGTGGFLKSVAASGFGHHELVGIEIDERLAWIANVNLLLHGQKNFSVEAFQNGGAFGSQADKFKNKFSAIITNPPFGSDLTDKRLLEKFQLGQNKKSRRRGILFLERCWEFLKDDGILLIILDQSILNSAATRDVREFLLEHFDVQAIISLPETTFMPYASVNSSIFILGKGNSKRSATKTFFATAERVGRKANGDQDFEFLQTGEIALDSDFPSIQSAYLEKSDLSSGSGKTAYWSCLQDNLDSNLRLDTMFHHPDRNESRRVLENTKAGLVSLSELCIEVNERILPVTDLPGEVLLYTGLAHIEPINGIAYQVPTPTAAIKSSVKLFQPGDILFSKMRPALRKVALADFEDGGYVSPECSVLRIRRDSKGELLVPPRLLASLLRSDFIFGQLIHLVTGIGRPRLSSKDLLSVQIPAATLAVWIEASRNFDRTFSQSSDMYFMAQEYLKKSEMLKSEAIRGIVADLGGVLSAGE